MATRRKALAGVGSSRSAQLEQIMAEKPGELMLAEIDEADESRRYLWASRRGGKIRQVEVELRARGRPIVLEMERPLSGEEIGPSLLARLHDLRAFIARESLHQPATVHPAPSGVRALDALERIGQSTDAAIRLEEEIAARDADRAG